MADIPVSFDHEGKHYKGFLSSVHGAGVQVYYLEIEKYYCGRLRFTERYGWQFDPTPKTGSFTELTEYFADLVAACYEQI